MNNWQPKKFITEIKFSKTGTEVKFKVPNSREQERIWIERYKDKIYSTYNLLLEEELKLKK